MPPITGVDSVVLQVSTNNTTALRTAEKISSLVGGKLEIIKSFPIRINKDSRKVWRDTTGRKIPSTAVFIALIHHERGQSIPLVKYGNGNGVEIHFHGLTQYNKSEPTLNDGCNQRRAILEQLLSVWIEPIRIIRLDRCIDFIGQNFKSYKNGRLHRTLNKRKGTEDYNAVGGDDDCDSWLSKKYGAVVLKPTCVYYQAPKRQYTKITAYDKKEANNLSYPLIRLEVSFLSLFFRGLEILDDSNILNQAIAKTDTYILKFSVK